jgi:hypothetical protein
MTSSTAFEVAADSSARTDDSTAQSFAGNRESAAVKQLGKEKRKVVCV